MLKVTYPLSRNLNHWNSTYRWKFKFTLKCTHNCPTDASFTSGTFSTRSSLKYIVRAHFRVNVRKVERSGYINTVSRSRALSRQSTHEQLLQNTEVLGWPKSPFTFFHKIKDTFFHFHQWLYWFGYFEYLGYLPRGITLIVLN